MRGSSLAGSLARRLAGSVVLAMIFACTASGQAASPSPAATVGVTIMSALGETTAFEPAETALAAKGPIAVTFRNVSSLPHNLTFIAISAATRTIVEPGTADEVLLPPLAPGAYPFVCTIHEGMAGILTIRPT